KPGLSVTPCHRLCAQGRKKALQQTISRVYLIRRVLARSYEKKAPPWRERGKVLLSGRSSKPVTAYQFASWLP
ncbi:MAG: hypothetical protein WAM99_04390, partial [Xanthobacteraceae bacterium]